MRGRACRVKGKGEERKVRKGITSQGKQERRAGKWRLFRKRL